MAIAQFKFPLSPHEVGGGPWASIPDGGVSNHARSSMSAGPQASAWNRPQVRFLDAGSPLGRGGCLLSFGSEVAVVGAAAAVKVAAGSLALEHRHAGMEQLARGAGLQRCFPFIWACLHVV